MKAIDQNAKVIAVDLIIWILRVKFSLFKVVLNATLLIDSFQWDQLVMNSESNCMEGFIKFHWGLIIWWCLKCWSNGVFNHSNAAVVFQSIVAPKVRIKREFISQTLCHYQWYVLKYLYWKNICKTWIKIILMRHI